MDFANRRRRAAAFVVAIAAWVFVWFRRRCEESRSVTYGPMLQRDIERIANLRFIYESDDTHCVNLLRMKRAPFFQLCDLFRTRVLLRDSIHSTIEEQVAMFLHVVGHNQRFRVISMSFRRSIETISRYFQEVLYAVGELRNEMIVPAATSVHPRILNSRRWYPYFKDCIGAIDGTHVLARVPLKMQPAFRGRKHTTTQNVLAAVDFDLRFTYVLAGWEGSAHDALILADALERDDGLRVPPGKFYLVDAGYAVRPGFLPPYRATRYHLREFGNNRPRDQRELFNLRHSSLRVTVERAFGALKNRFKILYNKPFHPYKTQVKLVLACCILHNWILRHGVDEHVPSEETWAPNNNDESSPNDVVADNASWSQQRDTWAAQMWQHRGSVRVSILLLSLWLLAMMTFQFYFTADSMVMAHLGGEGEANEVQEVMGGNAAQGANGGNARVAMRWTSVMSSFVLRRFVELVGQGVKTDKGFKEVHVNAVASHLTEFCGQDVTGTQVYNHLRKWRQRWVKICKLKDISGALWDDDNYMIVLDEEHLLGHTKDHPKDAEFLNTPIENYMPMQIIFGSGQATGKFAMGSNEPLGTPTDFGQAATETIDLSEPEVTNGDGSNSVEGPKHSADKGKDGVQALGKRKRVSEEEASHMAAMTKAVEKVADALTVDVQNEIPPGLYRAVMETPGFSEEALMYALQNLLDNKALGKCYIQMSDDHRVLWLRTFLAKHYI
ncbi:hypothetical protein U9M48_036289 [Paspalum notatum var. saurae]|uniref:Myb/SANT-like domain-containing protein n=1 Tax=Paspalum notatum var. saurae TaxID=547442 RepID=A0AAQ3UE82_PASNO